MKPGDLVSGDVTAEERYTFLPVNDDSMLEPIEHEFISKHQTYLVVSTHAKSANGKGDRDPAYVLVMTPYGMRRTNVVFLRPA